MEKIEAVARWEMSGVKINSPGRVLKSEQGCQDSTITTYRVVIITSSCGELPSSVYSIAPRIESALNAIVAQALERDGARLHLYCWMSNHDRTVVFVDANRAREWYEITVIQH